MSRELDPQVRFLLYTVLPCTIVAAIIIVVTFLLLRPCPSGERKNFLWCERYKSLTDISFDATKDIRYGGSTALVVLGTTLRNKLINARKDVDLIYEKIGGDNEIIPWSGRAIQKLLDDDIDVAFSSRNLTKEEMALASQENIELEAVPIAIDGLAFFVNNKQETSVISLEEIKEIYVGQKKSWNNSPPSTNQPLIKPFSPDPVDARTPPYEYFQQEILQGQSFLGVEAIASPDAMMDRIAVEEQGIGFASSSVVCKNARSIKPLKISKGGGEFPPCDVYPKSNTEALENRSYPLARELYAVIRKGDSEAAKKGKAYVSMLLSDEGQKLVAEAGYVPLPK